MTPEDFNNIPKLPGPFGEALQVAYIVKDIDQAIAHWREQHDVGPFLINRNITPLQNTYFRGEKSDKTPINIAFSYIDGMQLEIIQPLHDIPSLYNEALERNIDGVHHYAARVDDFPAAYNWALDNGYDAVVDVGIDGLARMSYVENKEAGLIIEVIEWNDLTRPIFDSLYLKWQSIESDGHDQEFELQKLTPAGAVFKELGKFLVKKLTGQVKATRRI